MLNKGRKAYSSRTIFEVMRWDYEIKTISDDFKISNDFIPIYVRVLVYNNPEFDNFFKMKGVSNGKETNEEKNN